MNIQQLTQTDRIIAQLHHTELVEEVPARFIWHWPVTDGLHLALFLVQTGRGAMWSNVIAVSHDDGRSWRVAGDGPGLTVRAEKLATIGEVIANITDGPLDDFQLIALEEKVILLLGMDPDTVDHETRIGEEAAERVYNEIGYNLEAVSL